jgi:integrase
MPARPQRTPSYRLHKPSGQAVVTLSGRDHYLGPYGTDASRAEYDRLILDWLARGRRPPAPAGQPDDLTISELILAYVTFADGYYVKNGKPTTEPGNIRLALRPLRRLYGDTPAAAFGPRSLKRVRDEMIGSGICRNEVNKRTRHLVRCFRWAASEELLPPGVYEALRTVPGLRRGRTDARESEPVKPVADSDVNAVRPFVSRQVWTLIELQRLTGMRPGEVTAMRTGDVDRTGDDWTYTPSSHKTEHHGKARTIFLGPRAQEVLKPWLRADPDAPLFQPREAVEERRAALRARRRTKVQPSQQHRRKRRPKRAPGDCYTTESYGHAIAAACKRAGTPHWNPHQLRHSAATRFRKEFGLDVARALLGHSSPSVTETYAEVDRETARAVMRRIG